MQPFSVVLTPRAERQLDHLYGYIAAESHEARADKYIGGIVADCMSLETFPERGHTRDDIRPGLRIKGYRRRVTIAFSVDAVTRIVAIHGIFYGGQDFEHLLRDTVGDD